MIQLRALMDEDKREQHRKERRHLIQDRRVGQHQRLERVVVAYDSRQAEQRPHQQKRQTPFDRRTERHSIPDQNKECDDRRHRVAEKHLLKDRQLVAAELDEHIHAGEEERRQYQKQDAPGSFTHDIMHHS